MKQTRDCWLIVNGDNEVLVGTEPVEYSANNIVEAIPFFEKSDAESWFDWLDEEDLRAVHAKITIETVDE